MEPVFDASLNAALAELIPNRNLGLRLGDTAFGIMIGLVVSVFVFLVIGGCL